MRQCPQASKDLRTSGNMILNMRSLVLGAAVGAVATWLIVDRSSDSQTLRVPAKMKYQKIKWEEIDYAKPSLTGPTQVQARVWFENGACYLLDPKTSLVAWKNGQDPTSSSPPAFRVTDESFHTREWLLKSCNGGVSTLSGHVVQMPDRPIWLLGEFDQVDAVALDSGLEVKWTDLESNESGYHDKVIRVEGRVGRHPQLSHLYIYPDESSWKNRSHNKALMLERKFVPHDDSNFVLLDTDGVAVIVEGVYRRPFRDDGEAPFGALTILHRVNAATP